MELQASDGERLGHKNRVYCVKYISENEVLTGGTDENMLLWDVRTGDAVRSFLGPRILG
jgi:WD40 repeat protein